MFLYVILNFEIRILFKIWSRVVLGIKIVFNKREDIVSEKI